MLALIARLILFMIAVSAIRSAVNFVQKLWHGGQQPRTMARRPNPSAPQSARATVLQQDPVCGAYVAVDNSLKRIVSGRVVHFCSPECRSRYLA